MANQEAINTQIIEDYRVFYAAQLAEEVYRVPLIAHHDPSIYFTNSTTSVMKPFLSGQCSLEHSAYLTQPAMGSQGILAWQKDHELGPYSSYFISLGSLYRSDLGSLAITDMVSMSCDVWGLSSEKLHFEALDEDNDITEVLSETSIPVRLSTNDTALYRHTYGMKEVHGRNANLVFEDENGTTRQIGNFTRIESETENPLILWEISFDSTPILACINQYDHPIDSLPASQYIKQLVEPSDNALVITDCVTIASNLALEGLEPRSRGKAGIMRKFFKEYVMLMTREGHDYEIVTDLLLTTMRCELSAREALSPEVTESTDYEGAQIIAQNWVRRFIDNNEITGMPHI